MEFTLRKRRSMRYRIGKHLSHPRHCGISLGWQAITESSCLSSPIVPIFCTTLLRSRGMSIGGLRVTGLSLRTLNVPWFRPQYWQPGIRTLIISYGLTLQIPPLGGVLTSGTETAFRRKDGGTSIWDTFCGNFTRRKRDTLPMTRNSLQSVQIWNIGPAKCVHGHKRTTIYMDHAALQHILGQNKLMSCQWCHLDKLQQQDYEVKYYPSAANVVADALSRIAIPSHQSRPTVALSRPPSL